MILSRYLYKEIMSVTLGITVVLLLVLLSHQFIRFLSAAAAGKLAITAVLHLVVYYIPYLLGLLLPLALYLGVLWAFGRLAQDGELNIIKACGFGPKRLYGATLQLALVVMFIVAWLLFGLRPLMYQMRAHWYANAQQGALLQTLMPGRFQSTHDEQRVYYVEAMSRDHKHLKNVFMAMRQPTKLGQKQGVWTIQSAHKGMLKSDPNTAQSYLVTTQGYRYAGQPGTLHFRVIKYASNGALLPVNMQVAKNKKIESWSLAALWDARQHDKKALAELQWRISMPLAVIILVCCALSLVHKTSGKNRYLCLIPALLIYIFYMNMLIVGRNWIAQSYYHINSLWWVHTMVMLIALSCLYEPFVIRSWWRYGAARLANYLFVMRQYIRAKLQ